MSPVEYADALSSARTLRLAEGQSLKIKFGSDTPDQYFKVEHVVQGKKHLLRAFTANGRLVAVQTFGDGQSMHSTYEKALEAFKASITRHIDLEGKNRNVRRITMY